MGWSLHISSSDDTSSSPQNVCLARAHRPNGFAVFFFYFRRWGWLRHGCVWLRRCRGYAGRHVDDGETSFDRRYGLLVDPTFVDTILRRDDEFAGTYLADGPFNFRGKDVSIAPALHVAALSGHVQVPIVKDNDVFVVVAIHHFPFINLTKAPGFSSRARRDLPQPLGPTIHWCSSSPSMSATLRLRAA